MHLTRNEAKTAPPDIFKQSVADAVVAVAVAMIVVAVDAVIIGG